MSLNKNESFIALLQAATASRIRLNRTKVAKLLYLADLRAVESGFETFTGYQWRWRHHGPYDNDLLAVERHLAATGVLEPVRGSNYFGFSEFRIEPKDLPPLDIDSVFLEIIEGVVSDFGRLSASSLKDLTYQTPPMEDAVEDGANEELLDFSDVRPAPDIGPALRRLRKVVREAGAQVDDAGAMDDLVSDIESLAPARAAANRELLG